MATLQENFKDFYNTLDSKQLTPMKEDIAKAKPSKKEGNTITLEDDGLYSPDPKIDTTATNNILEIGLNGLKAVPKISTSTGNIASLRPDGIFAEAKIAGSSGNILLKYADGLFAEYKISSEKENNLMLDKVGKLYSKKNAEYVNLPFYKDDYKDSTIPYASGTTITKYTTENAELSSEDDPATAILGSNFRIPTYNEISVFTKYTLSYDSTKNTISLAKSGNDTLHIPFVSTYMRNGVMYGEGSDIMSLPSSTSAEGSNTGSASCKCINLNKRYGNRQLTTIVKSIGAPTLVVSKTEIPGKTVKVGNAYFLDNYLLRAEGDIGFTYIRYAGGVKVEDVGKGAYIFDDTANRHKVAMEEDAAISTTANNSIVKNPDGLYVKKTQWTGTAAQYEVLGTYDDDVIYYITD